jgi:hypothetical protein
LHRASPSPLSSGRVHRPSFGHDGQNCRSIRCQGDGVCYRQIARPTPLRPRASRLASGRPCHRGAPLAKRPSVGHLPYRSVAFVQKIAVGWRTEIEPERNYRIFLQRVRRHCPMLLGRSTGFARKIGKLVQDSRRSKSDAPHQRNGAGTWHRYRRRGYSENNRDLADITWAIMARSLKGSPSFGLHMTTSYRSALERTARPRSRSRQLLRSTIHFLSYHFILKRRTTTVARVAGLRLTVPPTVFHPRYFLTSKFFAEFISDIDLVGKRVTDVGTGSGILALAAARAGAQRA